MFSNLLKLFGPWVALDQFCIENDSFDRAVFSELNEQSSEMKRIEREVQSFYPTIGPLMQDIFSAFYKYNVILKDEEEIRPGYHTNREILESVLESPEFDELKNFTLLDELSAAVGTLGFCQTLVAELMDRAVEIEDLIEGIKLEETLIEKVELLQTEIDLSQLTARQDQKQIDFNAKAQETAAEMETAARRINQLQQQENRNAAQKAVRRAAESAAHHASAQVRELSDFVAEWGTQPGSPQALPLANRLELASQLSASPKMRKLAKMVGRLKRIALSRQQKKLHRQAEEYYELTMGNDISRLIPYELMQLSHPVLRRYFKRRFLENKLLQYSLEGVDKAGKGPMIVCIEGRLVRQ